MPTTLIMCDFLRHLLTKNDYQVRRTEYTCYSFIKLTNKSPIDE